MDATTFTDNLLFVVFGWKGFVWEYSEPASANTQEAFDARHGITMRTVWGKNREMYFLKLRENMLVPNYTEEDPITEGDLLIVAAYTRSLFSEPKQFLTRLVCIAYMGAFFVHCGANDARLWTFQFILSELQQNEAFLASEGG